MMMFASDLDRTLIYSKRALIELNEQMDEKLIGVEKKDGREVAFMTIHAYTLLKELANQLLFVPVTTRTHEQYSRIFIFTKQIPLTYAITSNGANIVHNGVSLKEWRHLVDYRLKHECMSFVEMIDAIASFQIKGVLKKVENLFFYYILDEELSIETKKLLQLMAEANGWRISIQGRKLYLMPVPVCKGEAVKFIKEREGIHHIFGAGDSLLDDDFLKICDQSYIPSHGELINSHINCNHYKQTQNKGVMAGEEIIEGIVKELKGSLI
ncbi:hydroxymethylpyrimidine pyrophosphatase-like HAD family hydrolase [Cytobacillus eiseniae]|uniref:Hydroxymethylpyrimidine pyrophosphatase-like HAD family hydrolase n=1 Tax=Cytobacillus eiseniae TaxID=762947 RepID=A0ABS4RFW8_9BACI|nr:HAD family hydrolase [Cytobacillus eiseniae]MBP2241260.1 hydroxymethylpyrimidine pyrophosphatase-like HAD family hydrolase [Cytobacillus eiseniae]